jgi:UDP-arabinose 4-epimerase
MRECFRDEAKTGVSSNHDHSFSVTPRTRNILVTGGAGYIGSHTCKALAMSGYRPIAYDNLSRGSRRCVKWGPLVVGDVINKHELRQTIDRYKIEAVMHFAALAYVGESVTNPAAYFRNNAASSISLLEVMAETGLENLVFSSTCAVYGTPAELPLCESTPPNPINPYGESKLQTERMLPWFENAHNLKWVALRYFNAAGADPDGEIGENHDPETHLVPLAIQAALGAGPQLRIFGTDYPTQDGTAVRDYIHVADLADAHVRALGHLQHGGESMVFNLGAGIGYSVRQIVDETRRVSRKKVPTVETERRSGDPSSLIADATRAHRLLGWQPRLSDLTTIVHTAHDWERTKYLALAAE